MLYFQEIRETHEEPKGTDLQHLYKTFNNIGFLEFDSRWDYLFKLELAHYQQVSFYFYKIVRKLSAITY